MATYRVGPGEDCDFPGPFDLVEAGVLRAGDLVEIMPGKTYKVAQKYIYPHADRGSTIPITWRGISDAAGKRPLWDCRDKMLESPRACFEFYGSEQGTGVGDGAWVLENLEFRYLKNNDSSMNASAARNVNAAYVRVANCKIWNAASGVMSSDQSGETIIEDCDLGFLGYGDGHSHCIYTMGKSFRLMRSRVHDSTMGQNVKTRSVAVEIKYSQIFSSADGEVGIIQAGDGTPEGAAATSKPNSNAIFVDNEITTRRERGDGNRQAVVVFGKDMGSTGRNGTLFCHGNKFFCNNPENVPIKLTGTTTSLDARHNKFMGVAVTLLDERDPAVRITGDQNWTAPGLIVPPQFVNPAEYFYTMGEEEPGFASPGRQNLHSVIQAPVNVRDHPEQGQWAIAWDPVPGALFYRVWRYTRENGKGVTKNTVWNGSTEPWSLDIFQHYASDASKKREYVYQVQAVDLNGAQSAFSVRWLKEAGQPGYELPPPPEGAEAGAAL